MIFQLFADKVPRPVERIVELANQGFFNGVAFHRIIDGFIIRGGDPTGTGFGGSGLGPFDDQFDIDLQHNRAGLISFAKTTDDTNNSQFFITEGTTRYLDFNHSIFGLLVNGEDVREQISGVPTIIGDRPLVPVTMNSVSIFQDRQNGVMMLRDLE